MAKKNLTVTETYQSSDPQARQKNLQERVSRYLYDALFGGDHPAQS